MNTPIRSSIIAVALAVASCTPKPETFIPQIQRESQEFLKALASGNVEETQKLLLNSMRSEMANVAKLLSEKLKAGGISAPDQFSDAELVELLLKIRNGTLKDAGFVIHSANVGVPGVPQVVNGVYVSFVPARTVARYDDGGNVMKMRIFGPTSVTVDSHIVAVSKDKGKTWKYFEASDDPASIDKFIPETAGKLVIPSPLMEARKE